MSLIDNLLSSPHYGERWARHWFDVARYAESHGFEQDYDRPHAYHFRDFVIQAFNQDAPFDQFAQWQVAGDELAPDNHLALMATGFLGAGVFPTQLTEKSLSQHATMNWTIWPTLQEWPFWAKYWLCSLP